MEYIVKHIHNLLLKKRKNIAVAESSTGGLLSNLLTYLGESSQYFVLGVVAYSNKAKENILRIPANIIARQGAVSQQVAELMAKSVRSIARTDLGVGVTGIAGPSGGSPGKPVGTVFIAVESKNKKLCQKFLFKGSRAQIRRKTALKALKLLKLLMIKA